MRGSEVKRKLAALRRLLREAWDPIGVERAGVRDEFDEYAFHVFSLLANGASRESVTSYLSSMQRSRMGLAATPEANYSIVEKAFEIVHDSRW